MTIDEIIRLLQISQTRNITALQEQILRLAWEGQTYCEMADVLHYQDAYLKNIASILWQELSQIFGESITKTNFVFKLKNQLLTEQQSHLLSTANYLPKQQSLEPESPYGPVPLNSPFYIERPPIEELSFSELHKSGGVIRLKGPSKMGKSSLLLRILEQAKIANYHVVQIDFKEVDQLMFKDLDKLLRWLCTLISRQLSFSSMVNEYWSDEIGSKLSCSSYLQNYILSQLQRPLVISFSELHYTFAYPEIASNLLSLFRSWHEQAKQSKVWQNLRMILIHATEIYIPLRFNESPFNIGLPITVPEFNLQQLQDLAERHGLDWKNEQGIANIQALMSLVGGHPYLIRLAFYYLCWRQMSVETLISEAVSGNGIYREYLQYHLVLLQSRPDLLAVWLEVVTSTKPVQLEAITVYQLESLGLIRLVSGGVIPRCELYRQYFQKQYDLSNLIENQLKRLEQDNQRLKSLCYIDELTQIGNHRGFEQTLLSEWRRMTRNQLPLALILCHVAFSKTYETGLDHQLKEYGLKQVAQILKNNLQRASDYLARCSDTEFGIILPETNLEGATQIAERIRTSIELWGCEDIPGLTTHLGVAGMIPEAEIGTHFLIHEAEKALYHSKKKGQNTVIVSSLFKD